VLLNLRMDQLPEMRFEPLVRPLLICAHKARVPGHIGGEDRGETADRRHFWSSGRLSQPNLPRNRHRPLAFSGLGGPQAGFGGVLPVWGITNARGYSARLRSAGALSGALYRLYHVTTPVVPVLMRIGRVCGLAPLGARSQRQQRDGQVPCADYRAVAILAAAPRSLVEHTRGVIIEHSRVGRLIKIVTRHGQALPISPRTPG